MLDLVMDNHAGEKGMAHTSSNQQDWWIKKQLGGNRVWVAYDKGTDRKINNFEESNNPITLIGAGLKNDVIFKEINAIIKCYLKCLTLILIVSGLRL